MSSSRRHPRSFHELKQYHMTQHNRRCLSCSIHHLLCRFTYNDQQCDECHLSGNICQLATTSWVRANPRSTLGHRRPCVHCAKLGQPCQHDGDWNYTTCCSYCKRNHRHCWPLINFRGIRKQTPKLFSGVDINFIMKSNKKILPLLTAALFQAVGYFHSSYDFPKNFKGIVSTVRDARCRFNFGDKVGEKTLDGKVYHIISSYGSGSGATSVGTTTNSNYLMPITTDMKELQHLLQDGLRKYPYVSPFLIEDFSTVQLSINGGKGVAKNTPTITQTGMHCDVVYSCCPEDGLPVYSPKKNSQKENTLVAILTVGHSRILTFQRVAWPIASDEKNVEVLETCYFVLSHGSTFLLNPLDERPACRDPGSNKLSVWRHGDVRLCCNNPQCKSKCNKDCFKMNEHTASFSLAFRICSHSRTIDPLTHLEPLDDDTRAELGLAVLKDFQKKRNKEATEKLLEFSDNGGEEKFQNWLRTATKKVIEDFYPNINGSGRDDNK